MIRTSIRAAAVIWAAAANASVWAQSTDVAPPPMWGDRASVYLSLAQSGSAETTNTGSLPPQIETSARAATANPPTAPAAARSLTASRPPHRVDPGVRQAVHRVGALASEGDPKRRLAPRITSGDSPSAPDDRAGSGHRSIRHMELPWKSASTMVGALGVVLGAMVICTWLLRRGMRKSAGPLPREVVSILGHAPLAARNVAQLLRVGNKLVLISLTPAGAETLTEVTDPAEVDRLVGLCQQTSPHSTTKAFEHVFRQLASEPTEDTFPDRRSPFGPGIPAFDPGRAFRGGPTRG